MIFHLFQTRMNVWKMMEAVNSAVSTLPDLTPAHATQATSGTWMDDHAMVGELDFSNLLFSIIVYISLRLVKLFILCCT